MPRPAGLGGGKLPGGRLKGGGGTVPVRFGVSGLICVLDVWGGREVGSGVGRKIIGRREGAGCVEEMRGQGEGREGREEVTREAKWRGRKPLRWRSLRVQHWVCARLALGVVGGGDRVDD